MPQTEVNAVIGVWHDGPVTYYVRRSQKMRNYPGVWSLPSIQYRAQEVSQPEDLLCVQPLFEKMSKQRLGNVPVCVKDYLISGSSDRNPYGLHVHLHLYRIEIIRDPDLEADYYTDGAWLTAGEYQRRNADQACGLCLRLWSDYAWLAGITDRPFLTGQTSMESLTS